MTVSPIACGVFLLVALTLAGCAQTAWFTTSWSRAIALPLDGGLTWRGRRLFGANKTLRGFVVMVPATALAFAGLTTTLGGGQPETAGLWMLSVRQYAWLGAWAGLGFMAGELPNSFLKRQLGIEPGEAVTRPVAQAIQFAGDRLDSGIGMLTVVSLVVPTPWTTWAMVLIVGPFIHWAFSAAMFGLGIKARAA